MANEKAKGANGLITRYGWQTQGAIKNFPNIGGSSDIAGWNSKSCGQCYSVAYSKSRRGCGVQRARTNLCTSWIWLTHCVRSEGKTIYVLGIDHAAAGLNLSKQAMDKLTNNQATQLGRIEATVTKVDVGKCGLTPKRDLREVEFAA